MSYSTQRVVSDGSLVLLSVSIGYLERSHIKVLFNNVENDLLWNWVGTTDNQIAFSPAVPNGVEVLIARKTDLSAPYHVFSQGAQFTAESLDEDIQQVLFIAQEATEQALTGDFFQNVNMHNYRITNVADAVDPQDVMTLGQATETIQPFVDTSAANATAALAYKDAAAASATAAAISAANAANATIVQVNTGTTKAVLKTSGTGSMQVPSGSTDQRDASPAYGALRVNSTLNQQEWWNGSYWGPTGVFTSFVQAGTGAVVRNAQDKMRESVSVLDFFANGVSGPAVDPTGAIDSTLGIQAAIDSLRNGGTVNFSDGVFLIGSSLQISTYGISLVGVNGAALWNGVSTINTGGSIIKKSAAMTTDAIVLVGGRSEIRDLAVDGVPGNSGDGIYIKDSQSTSITNVCVSRMGGSGIRIGTKPGSNGNVNGWQLNNVTCQNNITHGVLIQDESTDVVANGPNANAGTSVGLNTAGNSGEGLRIVNGQFNTFVGLLSQQNSGYGVALIGTSALALYATFTGGDVEANETGNWYVSSDAKHITYVGSFVNLPALSPDNFGSVYSSTLCKTRSIRFSDSDSQLDVYKEGQFTPTVSGSIASGFNTYVWQSGYYTRIGNTVKVEGVVRLAGKGIGGNAMTGNVLISGLPYSGKNNTLARCLFNVSTDGGITPTAGYNTALVGRVDENQSSIALFKLNNTDCSLYPVVISDIQDSLIVYFSGTYLV